MIWKKCDAPPKDTLMTICERSLGVTFFARDVGHLRPSTHPVGEEYPALAVYKRVAVGLRGDYSHPQEYAWEMLVP